MKKLFLDLETAPSLGYFYGRYNLNISPDQIVNNGYILCYQAAWDDGPVFVGSLKDRKKFPLRPEDDKKLVIELSKLISEADVVIAHNAKRFDLAIIKARQAVHNLKPFPAPQVVDTLKSCRKFFKFEANSLDSVCQELKLGRKFHSGGFETSIACMHGNQKAWKKLLTYGKQDIILLRELYKRILPHLTDHPNYNLYSDGVCCPNCGSLKLMFNGYRRTATTSYRRVICGDCGASSRAMSVKRSMVRSA